MYEQMMLIIKIVLITTSLYSLVLGVLWFLGRYLKRAKKVYLDAVDCVTLNTGMYSIDVSKTTVDVTLTIPLPKLGGGVVAEGALYIQFYGIKEEDVKKIAEHFQILKKEIDELLN